MKKNHYKTVSLLLFLLTFITFSPSLFAGHRPTYSILKSDEMIASSLVDHLTKFDETFSAHSQKGGETSVKSFYFHRFKMRFEPYVAFGVPRFAELKIYPIFEIEMVRKAPKGFREYNPNK